jgi:CheY-like chemotaxis protein
MRQQTSGGTILCVDDHELGLDIRRRVLEMAGYVVRTATDAPKALEIFRSEDIDLVLTEHIAPLFLSRQPLAGAMKMLKPDVPIAVLTADVSAWPEDRRFADAFITKLAPVDEILRIIRKLLRKRPVSRAPLAPSVQRAA